MTDPEDDQQPPKLRADRPSAASDPGLPLEDRPTAGLSAARAEAAAQAPFLAAQVLADRYRIVRFIAQGGMGEVYEAEDLELRERVALKTIRSDVAQDAKALERFKREIQLARKVAHHSVSRVFDLGLHRPPASETPVAFLTMELLSGETLSERLRRGGRMTPAEALPIVEQMAEALAAAHKAGVVHRDFKSANVMLAPAAEAPRVVVTDFGLARAVVAEEGSPSQTGAIVGTADYMAPEQVSGGDVTPATDIYALGVVVYEMITGAKPFTGGSPLSTAVKRLVEPPAPPRTVLPDIDSKWEAAILRCLERQPADRFASATDVVKALRGEEVPAGRRTQRLRLLGVAAVLLAGLGAGVLVSRLGPTPSPAAATVKPRRSVAVLGFRNLSGRPDAAWLSTALSEMLTTELAAGGKLRTIPGENVGRMKIELSLSEAESLAADTLAKVGKNLSTDMVLLGSYMLLPGGKVRLDMRLQDVAAGETLVSVAENGTEAGLVDLVTHAGTRLRQAVGVGEPAAADAGVVKAGLPSNLEAQRLYAEGLAKLRVLDALGAKELLLQAVAADASSPMIHTALAEAWSRLGYDGKAKEEARKAFELSASLPREERLSVEARYRETAGEWDRAVEIHRGLYAFFADNLDYGLRLANAQASAGKGKEAMVTVATIRRLAPPMSDDPRIDLAEAAVGESLGDFKAAQAAARRAAGKGTASGARLLVAQARLQEAYALGFLGQWQDGMAALEDARRIYEEAGDRGGVAWTLNRMGGLLWQQGELVRAAGIYEKPLTIFRDLGYQSGLASAMRNQGLVLWHQGDLAAARSLYEGTQAIDREVGNKKGVAFGLTNLTGVLYELGDLGGATSAGEQALALWHEIGDKPLAHITQVRMGDVLLERGDLSGARAKYREGLGVLRDTGFKRYVGFALYGLGEAASMEGNLASARARHVEALALRNALGERLTQAESQVAIAALSLEEGRPASAEREVREAADVFARERAFHKLASAQALLAECLLAQDKARDAVEMVERAQALAESSQSPLVRLSVATTAARIHAATGGAARALETLDLVLAEARKLRNVRLQFKARLALGEIEIGSGKPSAGRRRLQDLQRDAGNRGFGLIARQAAAGIK